jgi:hypothetical protein
MAGIKPGSGSQSTGWVEHARDAAGRQLEHLPLKPDVAAKPQS